MVITHYERANGWRNSSFTFIFWFILALNLTITLRSKIISSLIKPELSSSELGYELTELKRKLFKLTDFEVNLFYIEYFLVLANLMLFMRSEKYTDDQSKPDDLKNEESPENTCSLLARLTFWWTNSLISIICFGFILFFGMIIILNSFCCNL